MGVAWLYFLFVVSLFIYEIGGGLILSYILMNKYCLLYRIKLECGITGLN